MIKPVEPKKILCIHDLSGVGRCSLAVILPVLSVMGLQPVALPTVVLSTHTGGLGTPAKLANPGYGPAALEHYRRLGLRFDCIYSGYLADASQAKVVEQAMDLWPDALTVVDPVMGDHGKIYKTYTPAMCAGMTRLAELADVIVPNLTEAAVLLGEDHSFGALTHDEAGYRSVVERLSRNGTRSVVLTGVMLHKGEIGACVFDRASGGTEFLFDTFIGKEFHGTGDVFASVLTGALVKGKTLHEAVRLAEAFVRECAIQTMPQNIPAREGVDFEPILWKLHEGL